MGVVVIGAGICGLACARVLVDAGVDVRVLERAPVPGGRLASPVVDGRPVDLGAAYVTVTDPDFEAVVAGKARPWTHSFQVYGQGRRDPEPERGPAPVRWAAPDGFGALAADLADGLPVEYGRRVEELSGFASDQVVLAMPAPQAARVHPPASRVAAEQDWRPSLAVALRFPRRCWTPFTGAFVNDHPVLTSICDDGSRRGDGAPVLVAHTTPEYAIESARSDVLRAVRDLLDLPDDAEAVVARRWAQARPARPSESLFTQVEGVFLAGDGFGRPRVEGAWLSGRAAAAAILSGEYPKNPRTHGVAR